MIDTQVDGFDGRDVDLRERLLLVAHKACHTAVQASEMGEVGVLSRLHEKRRRAGKLDSLAPRD